MTGPGEQPPPVSHLPPPSSTSAFIYLQPHIDFGLHQRDTGDFGIDPIPSRCRDNITDTNFTQDFKQINMFFFYYYKTTTEKINSVKIMK